MSEESESNFFEHVLENVEPRKRAEYIHGFFELLSEVNGAADWQRARARDPAGFFAAKFELTLDDPSKLYELGVNFSDSPGTSELLFTLWLRREGRFEYVELPAPECFPGRTGDFARVERRWVPELNEAVPRRLLVRDSERVDRWVADELMRAARELERHVGLPRHSFRLHVHSNREAGSRYYERQEAKRALTPPARREP